MNEQDRQAPDTERIEEMVAGMPESQLVKIHQKLDGLEFRVLSEHSKTRKLIEAINRRLDQIQLRHGS